MFLIRNDELTLADIPDVDELSIAWLYFAATFPGYDLYGQVDELGLMSNARREFFLERGVDPEGTLDELRAYLFFEYRRDHHNGGWGEENAYAEALVNQIRQKVEAGDTASDFSPSDLAKAFPSGGTADSAKAGLGEFPGWPTFTGKARQQFKLGAPCELGELPETELVYPATRNGNSFAVKRLREGPHIGIEVCEVFRFKSRGEADRFFDFFTNEGRNRTKQKIEEDLKTCFRLFLTGYSQWGGYRHYGWVKQEDDANFRGHSVWSESDVVYRFAACLEPVFPGKIHLEFPIADWTVDTFDKALDKRQYIDLTATDSTSLRDGPSAQSGFRAMVHDAFIEAKWLGKGHWGNTWQLDSTKKVAAVHRDAERLSRHLQLGRCRAAAVLVVDDEGFFNHHMDEFVWPEDVLVLIAGPEQVLAEINPDDPDARTECERIEKLISKKKG